MDILKQLLFQNFCFKIKETDVLKHFLCECENKINFHTTFLT